MVASLLFRYRFETGLNSRRSSARSFSTWGTLARSCGKPQNASEPVCRSQPIRGTDEVGVEVAPGL